MSESETAYKAAQKKIEQVAEARGTKLLLNKDEFHALDRIPPELSLSSKVTDLSLDGTLISDLMPLAEMQNLQNLSLGSAPITDLAPLAGLSNLRRLNLNRTPVTDLTSLTGLLSLRSLRLDGTWVSDLSPLTGLKKLGILWIDHTLVSDISPLAGLTSLFILRLPNTQVSDLTPLAGLINLRTLRFYNTQVSDLAPLARLKNLRDISLQYTRVNDLAPLANLKVLARLEVQGTQISDLAPLAELKDLQRLDLQGTQVNDLRPIAGLNRLGEDNKRSGLTYKNTPAIANDAHLAGLAQIREPNKRASETLAYLRSLAMWPDQYFPDKTPSENNLNPPEQDPALPLIWGEKGFSFLAKSIESDPVTEGALEDLRALLEALRRKGNRHDDLYQIAGELQERSAGAVPDLNMVKLHLSYQKLRRLHVGRSAREDRFDDETVSTMEAVFEVLPGVTLSDNGVRVLIERQEAERNAGLSKVQHDAAEQVLKAVQDDDAPFAPEVKDIAQEILRSGVDDRLAATRSILSRNVVIGTLRFVGTTVVGGAIAGPVGNFVYEHWGAINAYVTAMGSDAYFWANSIFSKFRVDYEIAMGITQEIYSATYSKEVKKL